MYRGLTISVQPVYNRNIINKSYIMTPSQENFTHAIDQYLSTHDNRVNLHSLATRHIYTLVVGDANVKRSELDNVQLNLASVSMVEDLAASYIALENAHPVEAVELAYQEIMARNVVTLSVLFKHTTALYPDINMVALKRRYILDLINEVPDNDNWLHYDTEDAWLNCTYPG